MSGDTIAQTVGADFAYFSCGSPCLVGKSFKIKAPGVTQELFDCPWAEEKPVF